MVRGDIFLGKIWGHRKNRDGEAPCIMEKSVACGNPQANTTKKKVRAILLRNDGGSSVFQ